uniref:PPIase cyclophilin-type domain-containing protein n=1 Tax=Auxenochlorella protothecoides TaxID=3075 RepID=A0A1D2A0T9_AUXPR
MGKGGTKFCGDAVGVRLKSVGYTLKDAKKDMESFLQTGHHPEVERLKTKQANAVVLLPEASTARPHVYMDLTISGKPAGRLVIELFEDIAPGPAALFRNRCAGASADSFQGSHIYKLVREQAAWGGHRPKRTKAGVHIRSHPSLRHSEKGAVSLARSGADFLWAFNRALHLDETHAVVGRVTEASLLLLDRLNGSATQPDDSPTSRVAVARCGLTDAAGSVELAGPGPEGAPTDETPEAARTRLAREAEAARLGLREALATGLDRKRKAGEEDGRPKGVAPGRRGMMESLLGGSDSDSAASDSA